VPCVALLCAEQALAMIADIRAAFNELLDEVPWIDESTRRVAREKVTRAMTTRSVIISIAETHQTMELRSRHWAYRVNQSINQSNFSSDPSNTSASLKPL